MMVEPVCTRLLMKLRIGGNWTRVRFLSNKAKHNNQESEPEVETMGGSRYSSETETHFGFENVSEAAKAEKVKTVFENVADRYDLMNDLMSGGIHRVWKDIFVQRINAGPKTRIIDVAGGTGDIAFRFLKFKRPEPERKKSPLKVGAESPPVASTSGAEPKVPYVLVSDINSKMLEVGEKRAQEMLTPQELQRIEWLEADAENLSAVPDNTFDVYTIAFGIRNCVHIDKVLEEAHRVLKPGGRFACLEFSQVPNSLVRWAYDQYSFQVIPAMGQVVAGDWESYQYLVESIRKFPPQEEFKSMIRRAGFRFVSYENFSLGVVAFHSGFKL